MGESKTALKFYEQSLEIRTKHKLFAAAAATLLNMGTVYEDQGDSLKALIFYRRALSFFESSQYPSGWSQALNEIGKVHNRLNQSEKALENFQKALTIATQYGDRRRQGQSLEHIGLTYHKRQDYNQAIGFYNRSLSLRRSIGDREGEASVLHHVGHSLQENKDFDLAILFYKESVNRYESIRTDLRQLPKEQQSSYLKTVERTYRNLADMLLKRDRILEAQQVLDLLKVQELNTYLKNVRSASQPLENLPPETEILNQYNEIQTSAIALGQERTTLLQIPATSRTPQQTDRIAKLTQLEEDLNQQFTRFTDRPDIQKLITALSPRVLRQTIDIEDLNALRANLKQLNAVMIYPLILDDRLEIIITTPDSPPLRRTVNVNREDLNKTILDFRIALQRNDDSVNSHAQKLYNWLIKPLEADLKSSNPKTLIYSPDGQLRYIPIAALHDGKQWLTERYAINHITAKSLTNLTQQPQQQPKILAGAIGGKQSESTSIKVGTRSFNFAGLPGTTVEVDRIQTLQPTTQTLKENQFTLPKLKPQFADYNILHLATHAAIVPGNPEDSFILFGGNTTATLKDIENWTLSNFDLVILSACETGLSGNFGTNGEEVLGLGYQFQNRGAKATIASLWKVEDNSTQQLMTEFYTALKAGQSKTQALQTAQRALIDRPTSNTTADRSDLEVQYFGPNSLKKSPTIGATYSHPHYWAPFILIGNGL